MNQIVSDFVSCRNHIDSFFANYRIASLLKQSNIVKECGTPPVAVMRFILALIFTGKNLFRYLHAAQSDTEMGKDTVYRFLNSVNANWRKFLYLLSAAVIREQIRPLRRQRSSLWMILSTTVTAAKRSSFWPGSMTTTKIGSIADSGFSPWGGQTAQHMCRYRSPC